MALEFTLPTVSSFIMTIVLLCVYSWLDLKDRRVANRVVLIGGMVGFGLVAVTGHIIERSILHLTAVTFVFVISYLMFRLNALGGADVKSLVTVAIISPGIEFTTWDNPVFEAVIGGGIGLFLMLLLGFVYWKFTIKPDSTVHRVTPLIPMLLIAYLFVQLLAFI